MALKILQPSLRPIGQFVVDTTSGDNFPDYLTGGECGALETTGAVPTPLASGSPIDMADSNGYGVRVTWAVAASEGPIYLLDEGSSGYGTLFGELIGSGAGSLATTQSGATVIGPRTHLASGKVTCWHQEGLYGLTSAGAAASEGAGNSPFKTSEDLTGGSYGVNTPLGMADGKWEDLTGDLWGAASVSAANIWTPANRVGAYMIGSVLDSSLVSTTGAAAGESSAKEYYAVHFVGASSQIWTGALST